MPRGAKGVLPLSSPKAVTQRLAPKNKKHQYPFVRLRYKDTAGDFGVANVNYRVNIACHKLAWLWTQWKQRHSAEYCDKVLDGNHPDLGPTQLDHIDNNPLNWHHHNIQILSVTENQQKRLERLRGSVAQMTEEEYKEYWEEF